MDWKPRIRDAFSESGVPDGDVLEELSQHAASAFESARADGQSPADAERAVDALIDGWRRNGSALKRRPRRPTIVEPPSAATLFAGLVQDARHGVRLLKREPGFLLLAVLTIALGIGATTTLFSVANGVLMKPLPWPEPDRLVRLTETRQGHSPRIPGTISNGTYNAWHEQPTTIEEIGGWRTVATTAIIGGGSEPIRLQTASVTPSLFTVLKTPPVRGRFLVEDDGRPGGSFQAKDVIVLSYGLWQERFGGRDEAIGSVVQVGGKPMTVVGVMPREFAFPDGETRAWTPWAMASVVADQGGRRMAIFSALARLRPGATAEQATLEGTARARNAPDPGLAAVAMFGGSGPAEIRAMSALEMMTAEVRPALLVLMAAVVLLLVTATANIASLQLARATGRRREIAVRAAIGAGAGRLTRQLVVESALLGLTGGAAGLLLTVALHRLLPTVLPSDFPRVDAVTIDARAVLVVTALSIAVSIACGVLPALHARRLNLVESLTEDGSAPVGAGLRSRTARARLLIMAGQLAVSCVLLVGASLLVRSFVALLHADRGYDPRNLLTARLPFPAALPLDQRVRLLDAIVARMQPATGVVNAAYGNALPFVTSGGFRAFKMRPPADPSNEIDVNAMQRVVSPTYGATMGLRLVEGRMFTDADSMSAPMVVVVNRSFATKFLGGMAVGTAVPNLGMCRGDNDRWEVVGVVEDMHQGGVTGAPWTDAPQPEIFMPLRQVACPTALSDAILVVRTKDDPLPFTSVLRSVAREQAPTLALDSVMTMEERVTSSLAKPRLYAIVLAAFGGFAVLIAGVGLFGVLSYSVAQRVREIGVRTALGARPSDIVMLVLRQASVVAASGAAVGLAAISTKVLARFLYGVGQHDTLSFAGVALILLVVSALACVLPARRAARTDPLSALRSS